MPTWNYAAVHLQGAIQFIEDSDWLMTLVKPLTDQHEHRRADRWHTSDAPSDYMSGMLRAIIGFEIRISSIIGKFKGSQNRTPADRAGAIRGLQADGQVATAIAELVPSQDLPAKENRKQARE